MSNCKIIVISAALGFLAQILGDYGLIFYLIFSIMLMGVFLSILDKKMIEAKIICVLKMSGAFIVSSMLGYFIQMAFIY